jgi:hypothetical protein
VLATSWLTIASKTEVRGAAAWLRIIAAAEATAVLAGRTICRASASAAAPEAAICILAAAPTILERIPSAAAASDQPRNDVARGRLAGAAERPGLRGSTISADEGSYVKGRVEVSVVGSRETRRLATVRLLTGVL